MANKFKVGDRIRATSNHYCFTSLANQWEGEVTEIDRWGYIVVKTTKTHGKPCLVSLMNTVDPQFFELISTPEIHITVKGNETIAVYRNGSEYKKAVAKCSPEDTFDFGIGAKLALERLGVLPTPPKGELAKETKRNVKFNTGDRAKIVAKKHGHEFDIGTVVTLIKGETNYRASCGNEFWYVLDDELEAYEPPKYYNGKVVCVSRINDICAYTVGKIYEFVEGKVQLNNGTWYPLFDNIKTLDEWNNDVRHCGKFIPLIED